MAVRLVSGDAAKSHSAAGADQPQIACVAGCTGTPRIARTSGASATVRNRAMLIWQVKIRCEVNPLT